MNGVHAIAIHTPARTLRYLSAAASSSVHINHVTRHVCAGQKVTWRRTATIATIHTNMEKSARNVHTHTERIYLIYSWPRFRFFFLYFYSRVQLFRRCAQAVVRMCRVVHPVRVVAQRAMRQHSCVCECAVTHARAL